MNPVPKEVNKIIQTSKIVDKIKMIFRQQCLYDRLQLYLNVSNFEQNNQFSSLPIKKLFINKYYADIALSNFSQLEELSIWGTSNINPMIWNLR